MGNDASMTSIKAMLRKVNIDDDKKSKRKDKDNRRPQSAVKEKVTVEEHKPQSAIKAPEREGDFVVPKEKYRQLFEEVQEKFDNKEYEAAYSILDKQPPIWKYLSTDDLVKLATFYEKKAVEKNPASPEYKNAFQIYRKLSINKKNAYGHYKCGQFLANGWGIAYNKSGATTYLQKAVCSRKQESLDSTVTQTPKELAKEVLASLEVKPRCK